VRFDVRRLPFHVWAIANMTILSSDLLETASQLTMKVTKGNNSSNKMIYASIVEDDDATILGDDATILGDDATILGDDGTIVGDDATIVEDDATIVEDDATIVGDDAKIVGDDAKIVGDDATIAERTRGDSVNNLLHVPEDNLDDMCVVSRFSVIKAFEEANKHRESKYFMESSASACSRSCLKCQWKQKAHEDGLEMHDHAWMCPHCHCSRMLYAYTTKPPKKQHQLEKRMIESLKDLIISNRNPKYYRRRVGSLDLKIRRSKFTKEGNLKPTKRAREKAKVIRHVLSLPMNPSDKAIGGPMTASTRASLYENNKLMFELMTIQKQDIRNCWYNNDLLPLHDLRLGTPIKLATIQEEEESDEVLVEPCDDLNAEEEAANISVAVLSAPTRISKANKKKSKSKVRLSNVAGSAKVNGKRRSSRKQQPLGSVLVNGKRRSARHL
jgi:hypothetical protein